MKLHPIEQSLRGPKELVRLRCRGDGGGVVSKDACLQLADPVPEGGLHQVRLRLEPMLKLHLVELGIIKATELRGQSAKCQDQLSSGKVPHVDLTVGSGSGESLLVQLDDRPYLSLMGLEGGQEGAARLLECPAQWPKPKSMLIGHSPLKKARNLGGRRTREPAVQMTGKLREVFREDAPGEKECLPYGGGVSVA